jgi:multidrug efflux system membrane fusion protein
MKRSSRLFFTVIGGLAVIAVVVFMVMQPQQQGEQRSGKKGRFRGAGEGPVPVLVVPAELADVPVYLDGVGTTKALNTVLVRSQVDGKLNKLSFREGQDVQRGYVLAEIDPTIYQAALDQAKAKKAQDESQLANARLDLERYNKLVQTNAASRQQVDTQKAMVAQLEAQIRLDQAAIDNAQAYLDYTKVTAPLTGRTGIRMVDEGNIIKAADATGIVVITQVRPIAILFSLPQQQLARVNKAFAREPLPVDAFGADNRTIVDRGKLQVVDNQVDSTTGTVKLKAEFPNAELQLWPGQFVNVRLLVETLRQVVVVPTSAVQRGPNGTFVYVTKEDDTVTVRQIAVLQQDDVRAVISTGLKPQEKVVTTGFGRLSEGTKIAVGGGEASEEPTAPSAPLSDEPKRRKRERGGKQGEK